jgi:hypothetical protein
MAEGNENEIIINEVLCFFMSHFGTIPIANIQTVAANFFNDDEILKAKVTLHGVCVKLLGDLISRIITHKGANKKKADSEDIGKLITILDENKIDSVKFVAQNLRRVPLIDPGSIDLCFMMESVEEMKKKVESLLLLKQQVSELQSAVNNLAVRGTMNAAAPTFVPARNTASRNNLPSSQAPPLILKAADQNSARNPGGMARDTDLRVTLPQQGSQDDKRDSYASVARSKKQAVVGSCNIAASDSLSDQLKASALPRETHIYVGNLDLGTTVEQIKNYAEKKGIRVMKCDIVRSKRFANPRSVAAHITIDSRDREGAFLADKWPTDTTIRSWSQPRRHVDWSQPGGSSNVWGDESSWH